MTPLSLMLKAGARLYVGPHEGYDVAARGASSHPIEPDQSGLYPIVGRAPGWWQILYRSDWHSPVWVQRTESKDSGGNEDLAFETLPWVRGEKDDTDFQRHYEARLDENEQVRFTLGITRATQTQVTAARPFAIPKGFRLQAAAP